eukprot:jgi/Mesen1/10711/ME000090S10168
MSSLSEYLKRYTEPAAPSGDAKKKKKRKKEGGGSVPKRLAGVVIFDDDVRWQKDVQVDVEEEPEEAEAPQEIEDDEVKFLKMMERKRAERKLRPEDGSGWVTVQADAARASALEDEKDDLSPPRKRRHSPPEKPSTLNVKQEQQQQQPASPDARTQEPPHTSDLSPPRRARRHDSPDDLSPPRRARQVSPEDLSPPRRRRHDSPDNSKRRAAAAGHLPLPTSSPHQQQQAEQDLSPPRRRRHDSHSSLSPSPQPPPRQPARHDTPDLSPPRRRRESSPDLSPPRRARRHDSTSPSPPRAGSSAQPQAGAGARRGDGLLRMTDGTLAGLRKGSDVTAEMQEKRVADAARLVFAKLDATTTGRHAGTVYRDKAGRRVEAPLKPDKKEEEVLPLEWGKGLAQKRAAAARLAAQIEDSARPFAQRGDDASLDRALKERVRFGDPMAHLVKAKQAEAVLPDFGADDAMLESGFKIPQDIPAYSWMKRRLGAPPNRYGIKPGRHWDGVDRSTGFEKEMFKHQNEKQALEKEAYLWSVADM